MRNHLRTSNLLRKFLLLALLFAFCSPLNLFAQDKPKPKPAASPAPKSEPKPEDRQRVTVFTEEVRLPVIALDAYGHYDPTLETDDVLVIEDGTAQQIRSVRHVPANVLLILDTGGEVSGLGALSKKTSTTRDVAAKLVSRLPEGDRIAIIDSANRAELILNWTDDLAEIQRTLDWKLFAGKRSRLSEAMALAAKMLADQPEGNRHIVLITDGVETPGGSVKVEDALNELMAARATVHVISYTMFVRQKSDKRSPTSVVSGPRPASSDPTVANDPTLPPGTSRSPSYGVGITFDPAMRKQRKAYEADTRKSEKWLTSLANDTGGKIFLPKSTEEMIAQGEEVAREIGAEYVVTYRPTRPLSEAEPGEFRHIEVASRRVGLHLRSRRGYVVPNSK